MTCHRTARAPRRGVVGAARRSPHHHRDRPPARTPSPGKRVSGPVQGFGQMWQKTFSVRVPGDEHPPEAVVAHWKAAFPTFWPKGSTFYAPLAGITPGEVALLEVPPVPGSPVKMSTGILVIYADGESFTFMTPEGHALSAWITFSAYRDADETVVQVQALERTSDPFIELSYMFGANRANDRFWERTLENLARSLGVATPVVEARRCASTSAASGSTRATCATAPRSTWPSARSPRRRAGSGGDGRGSRRLTALVSRRVTASTRSSSAAAPTGSPPRSSSPGPGGPSRIYEAADTVGGGTRSAELTLPGFVHDPCSAVHPLSLASPFFRSLDLGAPRPRVGPARGAGRPRARARTGSSSCERDLERPRAGRGAGPRRRALARGCSARWRGSGTGSLPALLAARSSGRRATRSLMARFGLPALLPATALARLAFREPAARALFAGFAAHSMLPLGQPLTRVVRARARACSRTPSAGRSRGAAAARSPRRSRRRRGPSASRSRPATGWTSLAELPPARAVLLDLTPRQVLAIAGDRLPAGYRRQLEGFRYGPGVFKVDWALDGPIPWRDARDGAGRHRAPRRADARARRRRRTPSHAAGIRDRPFVLLVQPTLADPSRAPEGKHVAWAYCHVPNGSTGRHDRARSRPQVERFAPGFRDLILARSRPGRGRRWRRTTPTTSAATSTAASSDLRQLLFRPVVRWNPYTTPDPALFLCSSSTPPGGGVHGMCGVHAARAAMRRTS